MTLRALKLVNDAQSFCVLAGRSIGNTHLSHIKRTVPREASCVLQFRDCLRVQPFLYVYLAKQEMRGREAWVDLQYFTALLNCFVVSSAPARATDPPGEVRGCGGAGDTMPQPYETTAATTAAP